MTTRAGGACYGHTHRPLLQSDHRQQRSPAKNRPPETQEHSA